MVYDDEKAAFGAGIFLSIGCTFGFALLCTMVFSTFTFDEAEDASDGEEDQEPDVVGLLLQHDDRGLATDEWEAMLAEDQSDVKWSKVEATEQTRFTIGVGASTAWRKARGEFEFFRTKLSQKCGNERPGLDVLVDLLFGRNSNLYLTFQTEGIFNDNATFRKFLATLLTSCAYQVSCKQLFCKFSRINLDGLMSKEEYTAAWQLIGNASLPSKLERNRSVTPTGMTPFWMKIETAFNIYSRELFLEGFPAQLTKSIDDDKAWVDNRKYHAGLKTVRHTKDNRNGNTCHTMVHSYSQMVTQIAWEREVNDSSPVASQRMINNGINPMAAPGEPGDLSSLNINKDRGYWLKDNLHNYYMRGGAKIECGTVKRQPCIPMTYDQKLGPKDTRIDIPQRGAKTLVTMKAISYGRELYCHCYRNGTGGAILGISTEHGDIPEWEGVVANPNDLKFYETIGDKTIQEVTKKCFVSLNVADNGGRSSCALSDGFLDHLTLLPVKMLTSTQGSAEWFMLRKFSLTSSTTDRAITACRGDEDFLQEHTSWQKIKAILGKVVAVPVEEDEEDNDSTGQHERGNDDGSDNEADDQVRADIIDLPSKKKHKPETETTEATATNSHAFSRSQIPSDLINLEKVEEQEHELDPFSLNAEAVGWTKAEQEYYKSRVDTTYRPGTAQSDINSKLQDAFTEFGRRFSKKVSNDSSSSSVLLISTNVGKEWIPPESAGKGVRFLGFPQVEGSPLFLTYMPGEVHGAAVSFVSETIGQWKQSNKLLASVLKGGLSSGNYGTFQPDIRIYPNKRSKDNKGRDMDKKNNNAAHTRLYWEVEHENRDPVAIRQRGKRYMSCLYTRLFLACKIFDVSDGALRAGIVLWGKSDSGEDISVLAAVSFGTEDLTEKEKGEFEEAKHDRLVGVRRSEWKRPLIPVLGELGDATHKDWKLRIPYKGILYKVTTKRSGTRDYLLNELKETDEVDDLVIDLRKLALEICDPVMSDSEAEEE